MIKRLSTTGLPALSFLVLLSVWETVPWLLHIPTYLLPRPSAICIAIWDARAMLFVHLGVTAIEALVGLFLGGILGFLTGSGMAVFATVRRILLPYIVGSNAIPVIAVAPVVLLLFGHGWFAKAVVSAFLCFFPLSINMLRGLTEFDSVFLELFRVSGASDFEFLTRFRLPNALPYFFSALKLCATYSVIGAVVAEFVGSDAGLGFGMLQATYTLATARLYGYVIVSIALSLVMYASVTLIERLVRYSVPK